MRISDWSSDVCSSDLAVDLDRIELVEPLALEQRQRRNVVEGIAEIGEQELPPVVLRQRGEAFGEQPVALAIDRGQVAPRADRIEPRPHADRKSTRLNSSH